MSIGEFRDHAIDCMLATKTESALAKPVLGQYATRKHYDRLTNTSCLNKHNVLENRLNAVEEKIEKLHIFAGQPQQTKSSTGAADLDISTKNAQTSENANEPPQEGQAQSDHRGAQSGLLDHAVGALFAPPRRPCEPPGHGRGAAQVSDPLLPCYYTVRLINAFSDSYAKVFRTPVINTGDLGFYLGANDTTNNLYLRPTSIRSSSTAQDTLPLYTITVTQHGKAEIHEVWTGDVSFGESWTFLSFFKSKKRDNVILDVCIKK